MNGQVIKFQEVACTLWDVVAQFKKRANDAQADLLGAIQLRNEMFKEKEALLNEKEYWARERAVLIREEEEFQRVQHEGKVCPNCLQHSAG